MVYFKRAEFWHRTGSRARSGSRSERTLDAVEHFRTLMEWWPFLIFHRGGLRIKVINNTTPGPASTDHLGLVEADDGFSQSVIVRVASAADGRLNTRLGEPLSVTDRDVLHAAIAVMHQCIFWV